MNEMVKREKIQRGGKHLIQCVNEKYPVQTSPLSTNSSPKRLTVPLGSGFDVVSAQNERGVDEVDVDGDGGEDESQQAHEKGENDEEDLGAEVVRAATPDRIFVVVVIVVVLVVAATTPTAAARSATDVD